MNRNEFSDRFFRSVVTTNEMARGISSPVYPITVPTTKKRKVNNYPYSSSIYGYKTNKLFIIIK